MNPTEFKQAQKKLKETSDNHVRAKALLDQSLKELKEEYNVDSLEEAIVLRDKLEKKAKRLLSVFGKKMAELEIALEKANA